MPSLEDLRVFAAVCRSGSLSAVASELGCSQSAVSQHVRRLERESGVVLLERGRRGVRPTDAGRILAESAGSGLAAIAGGWRRVEEMRAGAGGALRLATGGTTLRRFMPAALGELRRSHPDAHVEIRCDSSTARCLDAVREDRVDLAFVTIGEHAAGLELRPVVHAPWVLLRPARRAAAPAPGSGGTRHLAPGTRHAAPATPAPAAAVAGAVTVAELAELVGDAGGYVSVGSGSTGHRLLSSALERRGASVVAAATAGDWDSAALLVELGLGWTILPSTHLPDDQRLLEVLLIEDLDPIAFGFAARRFAALSPVAATFTDLVAGAAAPHRTGAGPAR